MEKFNENLSPKDSDDGDFYAQDPDGNNIEINSEMPDVVEGHTPMEGWDQDEDIRVNEVSQIRERIDRLKIAKLAIDNIVGWDDVIGSDRQIIKKNNEILNSEMPLVFQSINAQFNFLIKEILAMGEIKSKSRTYTSNYIVQMIRHLRDEVELGGSPDITYITSAKNLRSRVAELLYLFKDYINLSKK